VILLKMCCWTNQFLNSPFLFLGWGWVWLPPEYVYCMEWLQHLFNRYFYKRISGSNQLACKVWREKNPLISLHCPSGSSEYTYLVNFLLFKWFSAFQFQAVHSANSHTPLQAPKETIEKFSYIKVYYFGMSFS